MKSIWIKSESEYAWLAGLFEIRGSINITKANSSSGSGMEHRLHLQIRSTNKQILEGIRAKFGGSIYLKVPATSEYRATYSWGVRGEDVRDVGLHILRWLIIKKEQIELGIKFYNECYEGFNFQKSGKKVPSWMMEKRDNFYEKMKKLHKRD